VTGVQTCALPISHAESFLCNRLLDKLYRDRLVVNTEHAACFAWRRANPPGEFREVICCTHYADGVLPFSLVNSLIEVRDVIAQWTSAMAKRYPAVHASRSLLVDLVLTLG